MPKVFCKTMIHAPANAIWQVISDFGAACQYLTRVVNCSVEGAGIGALRTLTSPDGDTLIERLEELDEAAHRLSYALLTNTPFNNCLTTMTVDEFGPNRAELGWSATFEADGLPEGEAKELMEGALAANCVALKQVMER